MGATKGQARPNRGRTRRATPELETGEFAEQAPEVRTRRKFQQDFRSLLSTGF